MRSCFPDGIAGIWQRSRTTGLADAYVECPEGTNNNHGLYARNVFSSTPAPGFGSAQLVVNSPPGTYIDDIQFEANIAKSRNWQAGLCDAQNGRWLWCGIELRHARSSGAANTSAASRRTRSSSS